MRWWLGIESWILFASSGPVTPSRASCYVFKLCINNVTGVSAVWLWKSLHCCRYEPSTLTQIHIFSHAYQFPAVPADYLCVETSGASWSFHFTQTKVVFTLKVESGGVGWKTLLIFRLAKNSTNTPVAITTRKLVLSDTVFWINDIITTAYLGSSTSLGKRCNAIRQTNVTPPASHSPCNPLISTVPHLL